MKFQAAEWTEATHTRDISPAERKHAALEFRSLWFHKLKCEHSYDPTWLQWRNSQLHGPREPLSAIHQSRLHRGSSVHTIHSSSRYCPVGTGLVTQLSLESVEWTNCNISQDVFNFKLFLTVSVGSFHSRDQKGESGSCDKPKVQMSAT